MKMAESSRGTGIAAPSVKSEEHTNEAESGSEDDHSSADEGPPSKRRRTDEGVRDLAKIMTGAISSHLKELNPAWSHCCCNAQSRDGMFNWKSSAPVVAAVQIDL